MPPIHILNYEYKKKVSTFMKRLEGRIRKRALKDLVPDAPEKALDLISKLLTYDPVERLTAE